jgi:hypothetical protein
MGAGMRNSYGRTVRAIGIASIVGQVEILTVNQ